VNRHRQTPAKRGRTWIPLILPFGAAAALLLIPFFIHKRVEVRLDLTVSRLTFTCAEPAGSALLAGITADTLGLRGFKDVSFEIGHLEPSSGQSKPAAGADAGGVITGDPDTQITLHNATLDRLRIPAGARLAMMWDRGAPVQLSMSIEGVETSGEVVLDAETRVECERCSGQWAAATTGAFQIQAPREQIVTFRNEARPTGLWISVAKDQPLLGGEPFPVSDDIRFLTPSSDGRGFVSAVLSEGRIVIPELSRERKLYPGELLAMRDSTDLRIVSLSVNNGIHVSLSGTAGSLDVGEEGAVENILPSLLEWIHARSPWVMYLQDIVLIGTAAIAVLTRLKIISKGPEE
jgi:hypothetical protein